MRKFRFGRRARRGLISVVAGTVLLTGCSMPFFGAEPAPSIVPQTGRELAFETYTHPEWGYTIEIPQGSSVTQQSDQRVTTMTYADDRIVRGRYVTQVEVLPEVGDLTPEQILQEAATRLEETPTPTTISTSDGTLTGSQITFATSKGEVCPERNAVMAAYVAGENGYLVRVTSDGLNRCNTAALPETERIIGSFRAPGASVSFR